MKSYLRSIALLLAFAAAAFLTLAADDLPQAPAFARYEAMMKQSPFAVATAAVAPAPTPNFAKDLYVANAARTPDADLVTIASSTDRNLKLYLSTKEPVDGYSIVDIDWSDLAGETKVTIGKDGQTATLNFNQALLSQSVAGAAPPPLPPQSIMQQQPQNVGVPPVPQYNNAPSVVKPGAIPTLPTPPPRTRGVIPRNPQGVPVQQVPQPEAVQKPEQDE
jgi:hypothetical protein